MSGNARYLYFAMRSGLQVDKLGERSEREERRAWEILPKYFPLFRLFAMLTRSKADAQDSLRAGRAR